MTTDRPNPSKPRRRWFQFSLRTLLVLVTVLCVWLAVTVNRARKQREAVVAIEDLDGEVIYEYQVAESEPPGPKWLRELVGDEYFVSVVAVSFRYSQVTDEGLEHLKGLAKLESLDLDSPKVTDAGLEHLKGLTKLVSLDLDYTQVTDAGLEHPEGLTNLRGLDLYNTQVTDAGVKKLHQALPNCKIRYSLRFR